LIKIIYDFLHIAQKFRFNGSITISRLFDIIKYYNSYACQLILGAGAIHLNVIKTITAKILAFSSLCLSLLLSILDPMQMIILKTIDCNKENIMNEIKTMKNDISNHKNEILNKICSILKERLTQMCASIEKLGWHRPQENINIPTKFSAQILANTRTMYNSVEDFFIPEDLIKVFQQIVDDISDNYLAIFEKMTVESKTTAQRVREELDYFVSDLKKIKVISQLEFDEFEERLQAIIKEKCNYLLEVTYL